LNGTYNVWWSGGWTFYDDEYYFKVTGGDTMTLYYVAEISDGGKKYKETYVQGSLKFSISGTVLTTGEGDSWNTGFSKNSAYYKKAN